MPGLPEIAQKDAFGKEIAVKGSVISEGVCALVFMGKSFVLYIPNPHD